MPQKTWFKTRSQKTNELSAIFIAMVNELNQHIASADQVPIYLRIYI